MQHWKAYFIFSEKEQKGILVLGVVLITSVLLHIVFPGKLKSVKQNQTLNSITHKMFFFDPNTIDSIAAYELGLSQKQFSTLENYRNKGGRFKQATDIFKLYGLPNEAAKVLLPFVRIPFTSYHNSKNEYSKKYKIDKAIWKIDINNANIDDWKQFTKLDTHLIQRIIKYKNHIGFFSNQSQLQKVYGLNDSIYASLKPHLMVSSRPLKPHLLNSNTMNFEAWKSLGIFQEREIWRILLIRKTRGGTIGWRTLVLEFDLSAEQAQILRQKLIIND